MPVVHEESYQFRLGRGETLREGGDVTIIATGVMVSVALDAAELLGQSQIQAKVVNLSTLSPVDEELVVAAARETGAIVTAEEHYIHGGLGSIVAQVVGRQSPVPLEMVALQGYAESGSAQELMVRCGLSAEDVRRAAEKAFSRKRG
jgi:transketolase